MSQNLPTGAYQLKPGFRWYTSRGAD